MKPAFFFFSLLLFLTACAAPPAPARTDSAPPTPAASFTPTLQLSTPSTPTAAPTATDMPQPSAGSEATIAPTPRPTLGPNDWQTLPVIPTLSERAREIYQRGLELGNNPRRFSKVGDCQNVESYFLGLYETPGEYELGAEYAYLQETIEYYRGSFSRHSQSVKGGYNVAAILSPMRADPKVCGKNRSPLECEIEQWQPSIAIVSLEEWWADRPVEEYANYLRKAIGILTERGVLPILATRAGNTQHNLALNAAIAQVAYEYDIPLWNFWLVIQPLPNHGLTEDGFHLTYARSVFDDPARMQAAWPWRNLTALQALDTVRKAVNPQP